jgi:thioester reductase-like protein
MTNGARVIVPESRRVFDLLSAVDLIDTYKVTMTDFVPSVFNALVDYIRHADPDKRRRLKTLRHILMGGEEMNPEAVYRFRQMLPGCNITNTYGPTETSIGVIFFEVGEERYASVPIGKPIDNVSALLLDERLNPVPLGVEGELYLGGECVGLGYLNDPIKTRAAFVDNPFPEVPSKHLYRTGDLGYRLLDGNIRFLGRRDHQVKLHGVRIELGEIEAALRAIPEITDAKVLLHKQAGKQDFLAAYLATMSRSIDVQTVRRHLQERVPIYMMPARIVMLNTMPRDHNGKVDRKALLAIPLPEAGETVRGGAERAPSREEKLLTQLWKDALGVSDVGPGDNFFDLGGDSLTAVRLLCGIREHLAIEVPLHRLYASPTIGEQLTLINSLSRAVPLQPIDVTSVLSIQPDVALADTIRPQHPYEPCDDFRNVFITGASGFVGAHLLAELLAGSDATIHCLVRARSREDASRRIEEALSHYGLQRADTKRRIVAVPGNLGLPSFGLDTTAYRDLSDQVDTVFHSAAMVDYFRGYSDHRSSNVLGSFEVLRFAALGSPKRVHHISTLGVFPFQPAVRGLKMFGEADGMEDDFFPQDGYSQSKWVAEKLVERARANGLRISLFRLGEVMPSTRTGIPNEKAASHRVISGLLKLGICPRSDAILDYAPVDYVSRAVVGIARDQKWTGASFNMRHSRGVPFSVIGDVLRSHGLALREVADAEFEEELDRGCRAEAVDLDLILLKSLFARHEQPIRREYRHDMLSEIFYMDFTRVVNTAASLALEECGATFSTDGHSLLDAYARYCKSHV